MRAGYRGQGQGNARERWELGTADKALAKRKAARLVAELAAGKVPETGAPAVASEKVDDYAEAYFAKREARDVGMVRDERTNYRAHVKSTIGAMYLCDVHPEHIEAILDGAIEAKLKRLTLVAIRALVFRIFKAARMSRLIEANPVELVAVPKMREIKKQRIILTDVEFRQFVLHHMLIWISR